MYIHRPHYSTHAALRGERKVNVGATTKCSGDIPIAEGYAVLYLKFNGRFVGVSKIHKISGSPDQEFDIFANSFCNSRKGFYQGYGAILRLRPVGAVTTLPPLEGAGVAVANPC